MLSDLFVYVLGTWNKSVGVMYLLRDDIYIYICISNGDIYIYLRVSDSVLIVLRPFFAWC